MKKDMRYARENNASSSRHVEHIVWFVFLVFVRPLTCGSIVGRINRTYSRSIVCCCHCLAAAPPAAE